MYTLLSCVLNILKFEENDKKKIDLRFVFLYAKIT